MLYQWSSLTLLLIDINLPLVFFLADHSNEVKLGNPLLVLIQSPFQLLSHLLFERQVSPDRYTKQC